MLTALPPRALKGCEGLLSRFGDAVAGLDADHRRDAGSLKPAPGIAEEGLHGSRVEPAADLVGTSDGEAITGGSEEAAGFELFLQCLALGFCAFEHSISMADRVGKSFVGEIVKFGCGIGVRSLGHGDLHSAWVRAALVFSAPWRPDLFVVAQLL
jgi:hypothetical protein